MVSLKTANWQSCAELPQIASPLSLASFAGAYPTCHTSPGEGCGITVASNPSRAKHSRPVEFISVMEDREIRQQRPSRPADRGARDSTFIHWTACGFTGHDFAKCCLSGPMRRVAIANRRLTDIPHINTPVMLSIGPSIRHFSGSVTSP